MGSQFFRAQYIDSNRDPNPLGEVMFQVMDGQTYYIAEIITWPVPRPIHDGGDTALTQYAEALENAIETGIVTGPGKYAIQVVPAANWYNIFKVLE